MYDLFPRLKERSSLNEPSLGLAPLIIKKLFEKIKKAYLGM